VRVAQIVQPDRSQPRTLGANGRDKRSGWSGSPSSQAKTGPGRRRSPRGPASPAPGGPGGPAAPAAFGLGLRPADGVAGTGEAAAHRQAAGLEIDVARLEPGGLAAAHTGGGRQQEGGVKARSSAALQVRISPARAADELGRSAKSAGLRISSPQRTASRGPGAGSCGGSGSFAAQPPRGVIPLSRLRGTRDRPEPPPNPGRFSSRTRERLPVRWREAHWARRARVAEKEVAVLP
jgi:hypothetical protein